MQVTKRYGNLRNDMKTLQSILAGKSENMKFKIALSLTFLLCMSTVSFSQSIGGGGSYCVNSNSSFFLQAPPCSSYSWYISGGTQNVDYQIISSSSSQQFVVKWLTARSGL